MLAGPNSKKYMDLALYRCITPPDSRLKMEFSLKKEMLFPNVSIWLFQMLISIESLEWLVSLHVWMIR